VDATVYTGGMDDIFKDVFTDCTTITLDNVSESQSADVVEDESSLDDRPLAQQTTVAPLTAATKRKRLMT